MIEALDTSVAVIAMRGPWRSIDTAIITVFDAKTMCFDRNRIHSGLFFIPSLSEWRDKGNYCKLLLLKVGIYFRQDTRIHFPKHDHRHLHCYIEYDGDPK